MIAHASFLGQVPLRGAAWKPSPIRPNQAMEIPVQPRTIQAQSGPSPILGQSEGSGTGTIIAGVIVGVIIVGLGAYFSGWLTEE